jgi:putative endonuclease
MKPKSSTPGWHVYIVRSADGTLYTGITTNVGRRLAEHRAGAGRGARYLRGRAPLEIVYRRKFGERGLALRVEWRLKRLPRSGKQAIISAGPSARGLLRRLGLSEPRRPPSRSAALTGRNTALGPRTRRDRLRPQVR